MKDRPNRPPTNWTVKLIPRARRLYYTGLSLDEVARELNIGVAAETIRKAFIRAGIERRPRGLAIRMGWRRKKERR